MWSLSYWRQLMTGIFRRWHFKFTPSRKAFALAKHLWPGHDEQYLNNKQLSSDWKSCLLELCHVSQEQDLSVTKWWRGISGQRDCEQPAEYFRSLVRLWLQRGKALHVTFCEVLFYHMMELWWLEEAEERFQDILLIAQSFLWIKGRCCIITLYYKNWLWYAHFSTRKYFPDSKNKCL